MMPSGFYTLQQLFRTAQMNPQKIAVILDNQMWTYSELIEQIEHVTSHLYRLNIVKGQIIYQFVERSFEMICGLFGIMYIGGVYCPLNPTDPQERLLSLLKQTHGQYVLLHEKTRNHFPCTAVEHVILLDKILVPSSCIEDLNELPEYTEQGAAIIVCTSGTTGRSKVIVHTHKSLFASITAYVQWNLELYTFQSHILQVATSSWILHITEISLPFVVGGSLVLLRPNGHLDMSYFAQTLTRQQITTVTIGTSIIRALTDYLQMNERFETFTFVRRLCLTGEAMKAQQLVTLLRFSSLFNTRVCIQYGMSECNTVLGCELHNVDDTVLPIGYPLPGIHCLLIDEQGQILSSMINTNEVGQIHIGGSTLFNCYLNDPERTSTAFTVIANQIYIKTGDLARYNDQGELIHVGRIDFQIKIRGQRVETAEIENTIIKYSPNKISNCLITKISQNDDYLIAYIISNDSDLDTQMIRDYCNQYLCQYMVPFHIMILDKFPLNTNGKIDRKQLPLPAFFNTKPLIFDSIDTKSISTIEEKVHSLWCSILRLDSISSDMNCFALGGSSLTLMQLFNYYQYHFTSDKQLKILDVFLNPTIAGHVRLLLNSKIKTKTIWNPLHLVEGVASFAQQRLWIDEQVRFNESARKQTSIYNEILIYKLKSRTSLSINYFRQALELIVTKHTILRTALIYKQEKLIQKILPISNNSYDFQITHLENDDQLKKILYNEEINPSLFNLQQGQVFRCHVLHYSSDDKINLKQNDIIIFNFHHIAIDGNSIPIFIKDLQQALITGELIFNNEVNITYLDYAQYERLEDWSNARQYWSNALTNFDNSIHQQNLSIRTGKGYTVTFDLDYDIVGQLNHLITQSNLTLCQIGLAVLFTFLFKMSNSEQRDLCIGIVAANRSEYQLENMIGFFANTVPFCLKIDPYESFTELCQRIQQIWFDILPHLHLPYQEIIKLNSKIGSSFVRTLFQVETIIDINDHNIKLNEETTLDIIHRNLLTDNIAKFDLACALYENRANKTISVSINASLDLYDKSTIATMADRFKIIFNQLFSTSSIYKISLLLPQELELMHDLNNTFHDHGQIDCIHQAFVSQVIKHPQKLAVELDDQSLTYSELLYYVQLLSLHLLNYCNVIPGEIICQCVERSISMVIGIMSIEMSGCVYCPLSPRDPEHRLHSLVQQTHTRIILIHRFTKTMFNDNLVVLDIDELIIDNVRQSDVDIEKLLFIPVTPDNIAYIIFTSGSTSTPKPVQIRHRNFTNFMHSLVHTGIFNNNDTVLQMAACTFDVHIQEILGTLMFNATIIMLRPHGNMDFMYLAQILQNKQVTYIQSVPTLLNSFYNFIKNITDFRLTTIRSLCCGGEAASRKTIDSFQHKIGKNCRVWNIYGPAEVTIVSTYHQISLMSDETKIPIGRPLPNYKCLLMDEFLQPVMIDQEGELFVGGVGVFAGYLGNEQLTEKVLVNIHGELYYRTGDLVKMDNNGLLHYLGRKDHQIKLHGQRIELGEIEQCLLDTCISSCVVMKWDEDHLIAYVESSSIDDKELREHCEFHLPPHMIPSVFIVLEQLPLNFNGKLDRKRLPLLDFSTLISTRLKGRGVPVAPRNKIEVTIHHIWCNIFQQNQISIDANIFSIGGHSLLLMQLFHRYKSEFHLETNTLSIADLFQHPTIIGHAQLIHRSLHITQIDNNQPWSSLHVTQARASFAQERIFLDEQIRFASKNHNNVYVIPLLYHISSANHHVSITRLCHAFQTVIRRHPILRTALYLDTHGTVIQHCIDVCSDTNDLKSSRISIINLCDHDRHCSIDNIINEILNQPDLFDISKGRVIHCHILRYDHSNDFLPSHNDDLLTKDDIILINIHHAVFDGASVPLFLRDLSLAYNTNCSLSMDNNTLQYIDYSIHERQLDMTSSQQFWHLQLQGYNFNQSLLLPFDRHRSSSHQRSSLTSNARFTFNRHMSTAFINYASTHNITLFQLGLATFYLFLFKLNHHQTDLCITSLNANRYKVELQDMIGMFVSTLPYRLQLHPQWSFDELVKHVQEQCLSILEHSHYPLQHILRDFHINQSNVSFLETLFDFIIVPKENGDLCFDGTSLEEISFGQSNEVAKFDFSMTFVYNQKLDNDALSCYFVCSRDVFDETTVAQIAQRFQYICEQLFSTSNRTEMNEPITSISQLSVILRAEANEIETVVLRRLENVGNEAPASYAQARIWLDERIRFHPEQPSVAIYNMPFLCRLSSNHLVSTEQLRRALQLVIIKHPSLRTSLVFDTEKNTLMQHIIDFDDNNNSNEFFTFFESIYETDEQLNDILHDERRKSQHFDLANGLVFRCHILHHKHISTNNLLSEKNAIVFNFHHALFDFISFDIFLADLNQAYTTNQLFNVDNTTLRYLDYAVIEQQTLMNGASLFWLDILYECNLDQSLSLPYDQYRQPNEYRTGRGTSVSFDFGQELSHHFLTYVSSNNIEAIDLAVAIYYVFLLKLTNGESDICIGMNTDGRYRNELQSVIGMFVNAIPLRCQLDPHWSFHQLVKHVREIVKNSLKYSYYPLQHILSQHPRSVKPAFLDTSFEFHVVQPKEQLKNDVLVPVAHPIDISANEVTSKFDFTLTIEHDMNVNQLSCTINASLDLFEAVTVQKISQRFHLLIEQLFVSTNDHMKNPIYELSIVLPSERTLIQSLNIIQPSPPSLSCIHHEFVNQVIRHPQKLAVELDDQSLTYSELFYYVQLLSLHLLNYCNVIPGEIICQCVERSISMVIGIMSIEMSGCVYCPLSPDDPEHRLQSLIQQTQSRIVLVHTLTSHIFNHDIIALHIDLILNNNYLNNDVNINRLHTVMVQPDSIAYIIFTSGSTGLPKVVQIRHRSFTEFIHSLVQVDLFNRNDIIVQMASCSYDSHLQEIIGTLISGSSIVMLHPQGNMNFQYLLTVLYGKQVSYIQSVPAYMKNIIDFLLKHNYSRPKTLRTIDLGGDISTVQLIEKVYNYFSRETRIWNCYGPAETTIASIIHLVDITVDETNIPIGRPLPNCKCMLVDEFLQPVMIGQEGELFVGGVGVFAGYLGNEQLTEKVLVNIHGELYYRTGDLVKMDNNGLLHYLGRKDHQIKLHGQRIELGEIEQCLLDTCISSCVVMKWNEDHLIAYVESSSINDKELREHCEFHLPPHMIPSVFIVLEQLPLNSNGKIDRKRLPEPDLASLALCSSDEFDFSTNQLIKSLLDVWCQVLQCDVKYVSTTVSFFSIGGHSLLLIELYHRYQSLFGFDPNIHSITPFLRQPTIVQHATLLKTITTDDIQSDQWHTLHINQGIASFAQERIFLDQQIRSFNQIGIYNELIVLRPVRNSLSNDRLSQALRCILNKYKILRTSLIFNHEQAILNQYINDDYQTSTLINKQTFKDERELHDIIYQTTIDPTLFDLNSGRVFYCQVLEQQKIIDENIDTDLITEGDVLIFAFHHAVFDRTSTQIFLDNLINFYNNKTTMLIDEQSLQYIDYSIHERQLDMTSSQQFWHSQLQGYNFNQSLLLPFDRHRSSSHQRSSLTSNARFTFNRHMSTAFINYASTHNITLFQLGLATFYLFLFKLNHHQTDLCITSLNANRYKVELQDMIGMFVSTLPYRLQLHPQWSFDELVKHVQEQCLSILEHSHYPLQHILRDFHINQSNVSFLETLFDFIIVPKENGDLCFDGTSLEEISFGQSNEVAKFDFSMTFVYNQKLDNDALSCYFVCSRDVFDETTVAQIAQRFHLILEQLFVSTNDHMKNPIYELSIILPDERTLIQSLNIIQPSPPPLSCIHHEFVNQVIKHPQKLAVELDDQSLTYSELFCYVQLLSLHLLNYCNVIPGEIICQCVERSISMVIGMMSIEMSGCVYCPLSPDDPEHRLQSLIQQTQSRIVLVNRVTRTKFPNDSLSIDISSIITNNDANIAIDIDPLSNHVVIPDDIAYIIFTSGSTGIPKAAQIRHRNMIQCMYSLVSIDAINENDIVVQIARCSFDVHVLDIMGTLIVGGTVIILRPEGILDFHYLGSVLQKKQITYMQAVPSFLQAFFSFILETHHLTDVNYLRRLCSSGEQCTVKLVDLLVSCVKEQCGIWNLYGPAETIICIYHRVDPIRNRTAIPIGLSMPSYRCMILDEFLHPVMIGQEGELFVGGVGVFAGYLGNEQLTEKVLVNIHGEVFYRTGDLVKMDNNGLLHYLGRKDHQIKLHGQRIELGEIEQCLLDTCISSCVVMKWDEDHLIAYVESSSIDDKELREHCEFHLPPHMIPSVFIVLEQLPLNSNGKVDRKRLPTPGFSTFTNTDQTDLLLRTPLEEQLRRIFIEAFHNESPNVNMSFGKMGGTSLDAIRALWLIRQEICNKIDASILFSNPSIRQLAKVIEPLLVTPNNNSMILDTESSYEDEHRPMPSLIIELIGIVLLICQWLFPIWFAYHSNSFFTFLLVPVFHLLSYVICQRLMFRSEKIHTKVEKLYSWSYYRWWFLNSIWSVNNSYWLNHLVGTAFFNYYLRLCGAKIGDHSYIYTTLIDAPWLIEVGTSTFIGEDVVFSTLSYQDQIYKLDSIRIGSHCSINTRCVLYEGTTVRNYSYVKPMSVITGDTNLSTDQITIKDRLLSFNQNIYQFICLLCLLCIHIALLFKAYCIYHYCSTLLLPVPVSLALAWLIWILTSFVTVLLMLKFVVGFTKSGHYPINSSYYLHKIWLRQLIITSFHHSLDFLPSYNIFASIILRWLGASIEDDVKFAEFRQILYFPSNLLHIQCSVTTFGGVKLAPYQITKEGVCSLDKIHIGADTHLGNWCTLMPGTRLSSKIFVGSLSLVTRKTITQQMNSVLLGIPAREMPFTMPDNSSIVKDLLSSSNLVSGFTLLIICISFFMSKCIMITLYSLFPVSTALFIHNILFCTIYHCSILLTKKYTHSETTICIQQCFHILTTDFFLFIGSYLSGTQCLVFLFRILGAKIGVDVILPDIHCLTDPHLVTVGNHVRLNRGASIQCHTFEQRLFKLAPVTVGHSSILMSNSLILSGSILSGQNRILPWTLIMKDDRLHSNTKWSGVPAQQII